MTWTCERGECCRKALIDPFSGEDLGPREPMLLWLDDTCRCGAALAGDQRIIGECRECESAPACWEE
jgi:hypothetical protein